MLSGQISGMSYLLSDQTKLLAQLYSSTEDIKVDVNKAMKNWLAVLFCLCLVCVILFLLDKILNKEEAVLKPGERSMSPTSPGKGSGQEVYH